MTDNGAVGAWEEKGRAGRRDHKRSTKEAFGGGKYVHYFDCSDGFIAVCMCQ